MFHRNKFLIRVLVRSFLFSYFVFFLISCFQCQHWICNTTSTTLFQFWLFGEERDRYIGIQLASQALLVSPLFHELCQCQIKWHNLYHNLPKWRVVSGREVIWGHLSTTHNSLRGRVVAQVVPFYVALELFLFHGCFFPQQVINLSEQEFTVFLFFSFLFFSFTQVCMCIKY